MCGNSGGVSIGSGSSSDSSHTDAAASSAGNAGLSDGPRAFTAAAACNLLTGAGTIRGHGYLRVCNENAVSQALLALEMTNSLCQGDCSVCLAA